MLEGALRGGPEEWLEFVLHKANGVYWDKLGLVEAVFRISTLTRDELNRYVDCARRYLENASKLSEWRRDYVAYLSLRLLTATQQGEVVTAYVGDWAEAVVSWDTACLHQELDSNPHRELLRLVFEVAAEDALAALKMVLQGALVREQSAEILDFLPNHSRIGDVLVELLNVPDYYPMTQSLVRGLLQLHRARALDWAKRELNAIAGAIPRNVEVVEVLAAEGLRDSWDIAWEACEREPTIAAKVLPAVASHLERDVWGKSLSDSQIAAFYAWLEKHAPLKPRTSGFDEERMFRDRLLGRLVGSGTPEALTLLQGLRDENPSNVNLKLAVSHAAELFRGRAWQPLTLEEFRALMASQESRLINSDEQLLEVVVEALAKLQAEMHCETPVVGRFWNCWNENGTSLYSPREEARVSDELALFLRERLSHVVVNREVEIRPKLGNRPGEKPDILVQATGPSRDNGPFQVAVEVKGSWNGGVETAIETQLRNRYLDCGDLRCGIYVVGWFECSNWDPDDRPRQLACLRHTRDGLRETLESRARALETDGRRVRAVVLDLTMGKVRTTTSV